MTTSTDMTQLLREAADRIEAYAAADVQANQEIVREKVEEWRDTHALQTLRILTEDLMQSAVYVQLVRYHRVGCLCSSCLFQQRWEDWKATNDD